MFEKFTRNSVNRKRTKLIWIFLNKKRIRWFATIVIARIQFILNFIRNDLNTSEREKCVFFPSLNWRTGWNRRTNARKLKQLIARESICVRWNERWSNLAFSLCEHLMRLCVWVSVCQTGHIKGFNRFSRFSGPLYNEIILLFLGTRLKHVSFLWPFSDAIIFSSYTQKSRDSDEIQYIFTNIYTREALYKSVYILSIEFYWEFSLCRALILSEHWQWLKNIRKCRFAVHTNTQTFSCIAVAFQKQFILFCVLKVEHDNRLILIEFSFAFWVMCKRQSDFNYHLAAKSHNHKMPKFQIYR